MHNQLYHVGSMEPTIKRRIGETNDSNQAFQGITPEQTTSPRIFTAARAIGALNLVGIKSDGKVYLASAAAGSGQLRVVGLNMSAGPQDGVTDIITTPRTVVLEVPVADVQPGELAYLDDNPANRGGFRRGKPTGTGKLVQCVGRFESPDKVHVIINDLEGTVLA